MMSERIIKQFKGGNFDADLMDGLDVIESALKANTR